MQQPDLKKLNALIDALPNGMRTDWQGTNHYEISGDDEPFWLDIADAFALRSDISSTEEGKRVGLIMDAAAALKNEVPLLLKMWESLLGDAIVAELLERAFEDLPEDHPRYNELKRIPHLIKHRRFPYGYSGPVSDQSPEEK